jgi:hypothetical protein
MRAGLMEVVSNARPDYNLRFYRELRPISEIFQPEALRVNGLDRDQLVRTGQDPEQAMSDAYLWVKQTANSDRGVLVAYPLSFDWTWPIGTSYAFVPSVRRSAIQDALISRLL